MAGKRVPRGYEKAVGRAPKAITGGQHVARTSGEEAVVFIIGMRVNRWRKVRSWWPAFVGMPRMLGELKETNAGLLAARTIGRAGSSWSCSIGAAQPNSAPTPATARCSTRQPGQRSTRAPQAPAMSGSSMRPTSSPLTRWSRSTPTCRGSGSRPRTAGCRVPTPCDHSRANEQLQTTEPRYTEA